MNKKIGFVKKSDLFLCKKKNKIFVKSIRSVLWIKKNWICKENHICFVNKKIGLVKNIRSVLWIKKIGFVKKNQICFYVKERIRFLLKGIRSVCKVKKKKKKKKWFY